MASTHPALDLRAVAVPEPAPADEAVEAVLQASVDAFGGSRASVLQYLIALQQAFSHVPAFGTEWLVERLGVSRAQILAAVEFYAFLHSAPRGRYDILFSDNITDRMLGADGLVDRLRRGLGVELGEPGGDGRLTLDLTSCTGMCDQGPAALVNGLPLTRLDPARIDTVAGLVRADTPVPEWPSELFEVEDNLRLPGLLLTDGAGDDAGLRRLLEQGPDAVLAEIERAGLRGRGGAGFTTALKWRICREAPPGSDGQADKVIVCNADEGEPGTFKDRVLLTRFADLVFEGMTIAAGVVGARSGFLYLRGEYRYLLAHLQEVLSRRRARGLLGQGIGGRFDFDIQIHLGAGAYICGEESALIESLEGKRGVTRKRPPFPVTEGYLDRPTVVNNVETFLAAARIAERGGYWFRGEGTDRSAGSKILSVSGDCARPGIYEVPFGTPISRVLDACGAEDVQAVQVSGAAGQTLGADELDRVLAFEDVPTAGSFMVFDQRRDLLEMVRNFARFFAHESCGFCTPCRVGGRLLLDLVEKVAAGRACAHDLDELRFIANTMRRASHCGLGHTAPNHVLNTLDKFPAIYRRRLRDGAYTPTFDLDAALAGAGAVPRPVPRSLPRSLRAEATARRRTSTEDALEASES